MDRYQPANSADVVSGREPSIVRAASVRSSIRRTAVVTDPPIDAAWAANAWSFWRLTCPRQNSAVVPARTTKTASSSQAVHVRALALWSARVLGTDLDDRSRGS